MSTSHPPLSGYPPAAEHSSIYSSSSGSLTRPSAAGDEILSYYHSEHAGQLYSPTLDGEEVKDPLSHGRHLSASTSSSEYSSDSFCDDSTTHVKQGRDVLRPERRRRSISSEGGNNRATSVQLDSPQKPRTIVSPSTPSAPSPKQNITHSLRSRRGIEPHLDDLALPPDDSPKSHSYLKPPSTAPAFGERPYTADGQFRSQEAPLGGHHRSTSETAGLNKKGHVARKPSRDVAIVGTSGRNSLTTEPQKQPRTSFTKKQTMKPPIFQVPQSRSPSPEKPLDIAGAQINSRHGRYPADDATQTERFFDVQPITLPEIGYAIRDPLSNEISPQIPGSTPSHDLLQKSTVISAPPFSPSNPSSYLHYQPGLHATAGPLPPPPRTTILVDPASPPPPRPPRLASPKPATRTRFEPSLTPTSRVSDGDAMSHNMHVTHFASTKSKANSPTTTNVSGPFTQNSHEMYLESTPDSAFNSRPPSKKSIHIREGAFAPSTESEAIAVQLPQTKPTIDDLIADVGNAIDDVGIMNASDAPPPTVLEPPRENNISRRPELEKLRDDSWSGDFRTLSSVGSEELEPFDRHSNQSSLFPTNVNDKEPARGPSKTLKGGLLKRFSSLPRTPSRKSDSRLSTSSKYSRTPSPSSMPSSPPLPSRPLPPPPRPIKKIKSQFPTAIHCNEVYTKKSSFERSVVYAEKINELYIHDCGLGEWLIQNKHRLRTGGYPMTAVENLTSTASGPSPQPRHTSRASIMSEVTFPRRPDAYTATDLTTRSTDEVPSLPPVLPYPSLVQPPRPPPHRSTTLTHPPISMRSNALPVPGGKSPGGFFASLGRKASLKKGNGPTSSSSSGRLLTKNPPVKPNPRPINIEKAPSVPGGPRAAPHRVRRSKTIMTPPSNFSSSPLTRRSSLYSAKTSTDEPETAVETDVEFVRQVDKLVDLLPHVERAVLSGYLRRSGQDILAIGQYLEDEKNGAIRRD